MARYDEGPGPLGYLFRLVLMLVVLLGVGFVAYAYVGNLERPASPRILPVTLGGG
jgi:hypothetical protein